MSGRDCARIALGCIRLANGTIAFLAPATFARGVGLDPERDRGTRYAFRLFGIRTVLIGAELLGPEGEGRSRTVRIAPYIHAADTLAAAIAGATRQLPARGAAKAVLVSSVNTLLAVAASTKR